MNQFSKEVADKLSSMLQLAKGFGLHISDYNIKNELFDNCRATGERTSDFLSAAKAIVGKMPDGKQQQWISAEHDKVSRF